MLWWPCLIGCDSSVAKSNYCYIVATSSGLPEATITEQRNVEYLCFRKLGLVFKTPDKLRVSLKCITFVSLLFNCHVRNYFSHIWFAFTENELWKWWKYTIWVVGVPANFTEQRPFWKVHIHYVTAKLSAFYGNRSFIIACKRAQYMFMSWARRI
jgi:hypothetical protein